MKRLILLVVLAPITVLGQWREKEAAERVEYFKAHSIFITQLTLDEKAVRKQEREKAKSQTETINRNIRISFTKFWNISDTLIFVPDGEMKAKKKEFKSSIFFELVKIYERTNDNGQTFLLPGFKLFRPDNVDYFKNVGSVIGVDTSLVNTVTHIRYLKLDVTKGSKALLKKDISQKTILINKEDQINKGGEDYLEFIRSKYKGRIMEVDNKVVLDAIMKEDPRYIYVINASSYDAEDGAMIIH